MNNGQPRTSLCEYIKIILIWLNTVAIQLRKILMVAAVQLETHGQKADVLLHGAGWPVEASTMLGLFPSGYSYSSSYVGMW